MKAFRNLISITIYLFFTVGILSVTRVVIEEIKTGDACPKIRNFPMCYLILTLLLIGLIIHILNKHTIIYYISIGITFVIAITATTLHLTGDFVCPKTIIKGTPKCYYAVALLSSLIILKVLHNRGIEKGLMKT